MSNVPQSPSLAKSHLYDYYHNYRYHHLPITHSESVFINESHDRVSSLLVRKLRHFERAFRSRYLTQRSNELNAKLQAEGSLSEKERVRRRDIRNSMKEAADAEKRRCRDEKQMSPRQQQQHESSRGLHTRMRPALSEKQPSASHTTALDPSLNLNIEYDSISKNEEEEGDCMYSGRGNAHSSITSTTRSADTSFSGSSDASEEEDDSGNSSLSSVGGGEEGDPYHSLLIASGGTDEGIGIALAHTQRRGANTERENTTRNSVHNAAAAAAEEDLLQSISKEMQALELIIGKLLAQIANDDAGAVRISTVTRSDVDDLIVSLPNSLWDLYGSGRYSHRTKSLKTDNNNTKKSSPNASNDLHSPPAEVVASEVSSQTNLLLLEDSFELNNRAEDDKHQNNAFSIPSLTSSSFFPFVPPMLFSTSLRSEEVAALTRQKDQLLRCLRQQRVELLFGGVGGGGNDTLASLSPTRSHSHPHPSPSPRVRATITRGLKKWEELVADTERLISEIKGESEEYEKARELMVRLAEKEQREAEAELAEANRKLGMATRYFEFLCKHTEENLREMNGVGFDKARWEQRLSYSRPADLLIRFAKQQRADEAHGNTTYLTQTVAGGKSMSSCPDNGHNNNSENKNGEAPSSLLPREELTHEASIDPAAKGSLRANKSIRKNRNGTDKKLLPPPPPQSRPLKASSNPSFRRHRRVPSPLSAMLSKTYAEKGCQAEDSKVTDSAAATLHLLRALSLRDVVLKGEMGLIWSLARTSSECEVALSRLARCQRCGANSSSGTGGNQSGAEPNDEEQERSPYANAAGGKEAPKKSASDSAHVGLDSSGLVKHSSKEQVQGKVEEALSSSLRPTTTTNNDNRRALIFELYTLIPCGHDFCGKCVNELFFTKTDDESDEDSDEGMSGDDQTKRRRHGNNKCSVCGEITTSKPILNAPLTSIAHKLNVKRSGARRLESAAYEFAESMKRAEESLFLDGSEPF